MHTNAVELKEQLDEALRAEYRIAYEEFYSDAFAEEYQGCRDAGLEPIEAAEEAMILARDRAHEHAREHVQELQL